MGRRHVRGTLKSISSDKTQRARAVAIAAAARGSVAATGAITIRRSPDAVWPWIAQIGQGRGGFYSYDFLENLLGFDIHSADRVVPEWQEIAVGDGVRRAAKAGLNAAIVEPGRALVLQGSLPIAQRPPFDSTWAFILNEQADGT